MQDRWSLTRKVLAVAAIGVLVSGLAGCGDDNRSKPQAQTEAPVEFDPKIEVLETPAEFEIQDSAGRTFTLTIGAPEVRVTGVEKAVAEGFADAVAEEFRSSVQGQLDKYRSLDLIRCIGEPYGEIAPGSTCELNTGGLVIEHAGVYGDYGTVVTRTSFLMNDAGGERNPQIHGITWNLRTGGAVAMAEFLDLADPGAQSRAISGLGVAADWGMCTLLNPPTDALEYLGTAAAFAPTTNGVNLYWAPNGYPSECQAAEALVGWPADHQQPKMAEDPQASDPKTAVGINGKWCPTPDSADGEEGCITIALPLATYENGRTVELTGGDEFDGGFAYSVPGAPFGSYYAAGTGIDMGSVGQVADRPDEDRIWNGQTLTMYVRS